MLSPMPFCRHVLTSSGKAKDINENMDDNQFFIGIDQNKSFSYPW